MGKDIGIIAPYAAQIQLLNRFLNADPQYRERFNSVLGSHRAMQLEHVEIKTVDGFEGREKEVIIFSTVRNNEEGHIGFLADKKRLNVGLTRAKRGLFVLGSIKTLQAGKPPSEDVGRHGILDGEPVATLTLAEVERGLKKDNDRKRTKKTAVTTKVDTNHNEGTPASKTSNTKATRWRPPAKTKGRLTALQFNLRRHAPRAARKLRARSCMWPALYLLLG